MWQFGEEVRAQEIGLTDMLNDPSSLPSLIIHDSMLNQPTNLHPSILSSTYLFSLRTLFSLSFSPHPLLSLDHSLDTTLT